MHQLGCLADVNIHRQPGRFHLASGDICLARLEGGDCKSDVGYLLADQSGCLEEPLQVVLDLLRPRSGQDRHQHQCGGEQDGVEVSLPFEQIEQARLVPEY